MSSQAFSPDTEIVLLLCGRFGGERQEPFQPLSAREYGEFAKWLNSRGLRPADLLSELGQMKLAGVHEAKLERKRVDFLLGRGTALALAMERWSRGGLWVISRGDPEFPKRLKRHLKHAAPPLLYGAGDKTAREMRLRPLLILRLQLHRVVHGRAWVWCLEVRVALTLQRCREPLKQEGCLSVFLPVTYLSRA